MNWLKKSFICLICLIAIVPFVEGKRRQEESNIRQQQQVEASDQQQMTPELVEFKNELIAALEIPQAVQILYDLFAFLSTPLDISIDAAEALVEATSRDNTKQQNNLNVQDNDEDATGAVRQLSEIVDAAELTTPLEFPSLDPESMPSTGFVDSVLSMAELIEISRTAPDSGESEQIMEGDTVAARVRHLQALNDMRMRAGEVVGDVLYGKQPTITKMLTPQRGPIETVLYGRSPMPRNRRRGIL